MRIFCFIVVLLVVHAARAARPDVTKLVDNGDDERKRVIVVLGDGYAATDMATYAADVASLVTDGMFAHDFYQAYRGAFNVYRVDTISASSGAAKTAAQAESRALHTIYNGKWDECWITETDESRREIERVIDDLGLKADYILVVVNEGDGFGGCTRGDKLYVTKSAKTGWGVVAHEYGHGIGNLYDEYQVLEGADPEAPINTRNCSTALDSVAVTWHDMLTPGVQIPTPPSAPPGTVGMFEGCDTYKKGIYRATQGCRMVSNTPAFCPVCQKVLRDILIPFLTPQNPLVRGPTTAPTDNAGAPNAPTTSEGLHSVQLVVQLQLTGNKGDNNAMIEILRAVERKGSILQPKIDNPSTVLEITGQPGKAAVPINVASSPFSARSVSEIPGGEHKIIASNVGTVTVNLPGTRFKDLEQAPIAIALSELGEQKSSASGPPDLTGTPPTAHAPGRKMKKMIVKARSNRQQFATSFKAARSAALLRDGAR